MLACSHYIYLPNLTLTCGSRGCIIPLYDIINTSLLWATRAVVYTGDIIYSHILVQYTHTVWNIWCTSAYCDVNYLTVDIPTIWSRVHYDVDDTILVLTVHIVDIILSHSRIHGVHTKMQTTSHSHKYTNLVIIYDYFYTG